MATQYAPTARLIWSLTDSGLGTTITTAGNSGAWSGTGAAFAALTPVDLRDATDVALMVTVGGITGTPAFTVLLNVFDDLGNAYASGITTTSIATASSALISGGMHGLTGKQLILPAWGQVAWTQTGGGASVTGVEIALYGR